MALPNNSVKVIDVCRVAPQPQQDQELSLPLTFFDLLWLRFPHFHRLFFYETPSSASADSILARLRTSLCVTLQHFLPIAGNITWPQDSPKPLLTYSKGDAVSLTIAHSDADFHHLSSNKFNIEAKEYHPLVPQLEISHEKAANMAFQVTIFPNNSGFSIGISMRHAALDGKTLFLFLKSWAHICKHGQSNLLPDQLKPSFDRRVIQDPTGLELEAIYLNQFLNMDRPNNRSLMVIPRYLAPALTIRGIFEFTREKIEALRQSVMTKMTKMLKKQEYHQSVHLSTFSLTCAYTWVCLAKAEAEEQQGDKILMILSVDCRSRLDPPIPATYFGNCITGHAAVAERKGILGEDGFFVAVNSISEAIKGFDNAVLNGAENLISDIYNDVQMSSTDNPRVFSTAGSHHFEMYDTDFGWGRPTRTEVVPIGRPGAITFSDSKNGGGGVDIGLVLKKHHMEDFASQFAKGFEIL